MGRKFSSLEDMDRQKMIFNNIYENKRVLITGHAGFKGSWLSLWLKSLGAQVFGYSLLPNTEKRLFEVLDLGHSLDGSLIENIENEKALNTFFQECRPEIVFHLAAQPIVRLSYTEPVLTYKTNVIGTLNVLEAARQTPSVRAFVNITTDKCYENNEKTEGYKENEPMGGYDMYSSSKACSEILSSSYRRSFLKDGKPFALATARAGNVIGGGDWAKDRLIPDCVRAFEKNETVFIRNPLSTRPWQFVLEPLAGYLRLGQKLLEQGDQYATSYNFGPEMNQNIRVCEVVKRLAEIWGENSQVKTGDAGDLHEASLLQLNIEKAQKELGIMPVYSAEEAIVKTILWYKAFYEGKVDMISFTKQQLNDFVLKAKSKGLEWII